jgi:hypothetical protein
MLRKLKIMDRLFDLQVDPTPVGHFASAQRISRSSCKIVLASAICRSKSREQGVKR